ncbi:MAG: sigma-70 family RNA polymerase sigma factor [Planctomycetes bacterium]|nr:sigma-70 family RNA polymerase sigma factor [Planctomycetota bacterium]
MRKEDVDQHERFLTLFTANEPAIRAFVRRLLPSRQDAADVMQGIALVLWRKFNASENSEDFRKWAFGVARLEVLGWLRDKGRDRLVLGAHVLEILAEESSTDDDRLSAQRDALDGCLEQLTARQRSLVLAAYAPDTQIQEVAEQSGRTVNAFYQWLHRIRVQLVNCTRRSLQAEGLS